MTSSNSEINSQIISVAIPRPLEGLFTYLISDEFSKKVKIGSWVKVPFGKTQTHAYVVELPKSLSELPESLQNVPLKSVLEVGTSEFVLPEDVYRVCQWASDYYYIPMGEVLSSAAPTVVLEPKAPTKNGSKKKSNTDDFLKELKTPEPIHLTDEQEKVILDFEQWFSQHPQSTGFLLEGVTGSGKTEVYLELSKKILKKNQSVLVLVPEIALTDQIKKRFESALGIPVALWHSSVSEAKRRDQYYDILSGKYSVVVGARSAVFAPLKNLGLIIVDEEHDPTYKQDERARYHARDLCLVRGKVSGAKILLGSATPSLESQVRVQEKKYGYSVLKNRFSESKLPEIEIVDLKTELKQTDTQALLAEKTLKEIQETLDKGQQVMIFLNRRGFAQFLICEDCGEIRNCKNCSLSLTYHKKIHKLKCHVCDYSCAIPEQCEKCLGYQLKPIGMGTEGLEDDLRTKLSGANILRLDRDQITSVSRLEKTLQSFRKGESNLLIGTQMLVKGHDFPNVTLVVVILADALFRWPDFRAQERALQILKQVSGRAGRGKHPGRVLIQTYAPNHEILSVLQSDEIALLGFYENELAVRKVLKYPPFSRLARIRFESTNLKECKARAELLANVLIKDLKAGETELLGPSEAFLEKAKGVYRWDILLKSDTINSLQKLVSRARSVCIKNKWQFWVDIDPVST